MVKTFQYNQPIITALGRTLSQDRLSTYLAATAGKMEEALHLYNWNADVSGALYAPLQGLEIALRNALHDVLSSSYSPAWYDSPKINMDAYTTGDIRKAKDILARRGALLTPPNIMAELSFGFWVSLLASNYHVQLWIPTLHKSFLNLGSKKRRDVYHALNHLRKLRNRIAHHEPIFNRHLVADYDSIITAIDWVCPKTATWVDAHSIFRKVWDERP
jgi:hypothetical protein